MAKYTIHPIRNSIEVDDSVLFDILTIAYEGGIDYWAETLSPRRDELLRVTFLSITGDGEEQFDPPHDLYAGDIARGVQLYIDKYSEGSYRPGEELYHEIRDWDNRGGCFVDAGVADCIVQLACFGEIVYG